MDIDELIIIRNAILNAVDGKSNQSVLSTINDLDTYIHNQKNNKNLPIYSVVVAERTLCQHESVTNRICDNCKCIITYVPD
jgi:hypothetical protein